MGAILLRRCPSGHDGQNALSKSCPLLLAPNVYITKYNMPSARHIFIYECPFSQLPSLCWWIQSLVMPSICRPNENVSNSFRCWYRIHFQRNADKCKIQIHIYERRFLAGSRKVFAFVQCPVCWWACTNQLSSSCKYKYSAITNTNTAQLQIQIQRNCKHNHSANTNTVQLQKQIQHNCKYKYNAIVYKNTVQLQTLLGSCVKCFCLHWYFCNDPEWLFWHKNTNNIFK